MSKQLIILLFFEYYSQYHKLKVTPRNSQQARVLNDFSKWVSNQKLTFFEEVLE